MRANDTTREICRLVQDATAASDVGDHEHADSLLERCIELDDGTDADILGDADLPPLRLRPYLILANDLLKRGDAAKALRPLDRASGRWANQPDLHLSLGRCHHALEHWPEAEAAYRRCIELEPRAYVCILLASMLDQLGRDEEAVWWLHHSLLVDPDYEEAHYNIGHLLAKQGYIDGAVARFERAIELDPDYVDAHVALGRLLFELTLQASRPMEHADWQTAFAHLSRAAELDPSDVRARESLASMRSETERIR